MRTNILQFKQIKICLYFITLVSLFACSEKKEIAKTQLSKLSPKFSSDWLIFRGSPELSGTAPKTSSQKLEQYQKLQLLWSVKLKNKKEHDSFSSTPVIKDKKLFIGGENGTIYAISCLKGKELWRYSTDDSFEASPAIHDKTLFVGSSAGIFTAIDIETGTKKWIFETSAKIAGAPNIAKSENKTLVVFGSYDNNLYALNCADGEKIWSSKSDHYINGTPAVSDGKIMFGGCDGRLRCISVKNGKALFKIKTDSYIPASPAIFASCCFTALYSGKLICIDLKTQKILWTFEDENRKGSFISSPAASSESLIIGSKNRYLYSINPLSGSKTWYFRASGAFEAAPIIIRNRVIATSNDGIIYLLNLKTGELIHKYEIGETLTAAPALSGNTIFIASETGTLYALILTP